MDSTSPSTPTRSDALPTPSIAALLEGHAQPDEPLVRVQWFTDPFSAWCWAFEPTWLKVTEVFGSLLCVEPIATGLYRSAEELTRSASAFNRPEQIAMQWEEVAHLSGMPLDSERWLRGAVSSWPACAALKAGWRMDPVKGWRYLRRLREAALCEGRALEDPAELGALATESGLEGEAVESALVDGSAGALLEADLEHAAETGAMGSPGFLFFGPAGIQDLRGARPFEEIAEAIVSVCGEPAELVGDPPAVADRQAYLVALAEARGSVAAAEAAVLLEIDPADATDLLDRMAAGGRLTRTPVGRRALYRLP